MQIKYNSKMNQQDDSKIVLRAASTVAAARLGRRLSIRYSATRGPHMYRYYNQNPNIKNGSDDVSHAAVVVDEEKFQQFQSSKWFQIVKKDVAKRTQMMLMEWKYLFL